MPLHYSKVVAVNVEPRIMVYTLFHRGHRNEIGINGARLTRPLQVITIPDDYATLWTKCTNYELFKTCKYLFWL